MVDMAIIFDTLRDLLSKSKISRYRIARDTGIAESMLSRFVSGERGLSVESTEKLADYLGHEIIVRPKRQRKGK